MNMGMRMTKCSFCPADTENPPSYTGDYYCDDCQGEMEQYFSDRAEGVYESAEVRTSPIVKDD